MNKALTKKTVGVALVVVILFAAGGIYYSQTSKHVLGTADTTTSKRELDPMMRVTTPAPLTKRQKEQLANGKSTATKEKTFYITGGNYYFTPNTITVNQSDKIAIVFTNTSGRHDFVLPQLHAKSQILQPGQLQVINFVADKKGTYTFYSDLKQDQQMDMKGTLIVQ